jgi:hypothetical protein
LVKDWSLDDTLWYNAKALKARSENSGRLGPRETPAPQLLR